MPALPALLTAHRGEEGAPFPSSKSLVETAVHWVHSLSAVGWGLTVAVLVALATPAARRLLTDEARRFFDARLESIVMASGVFTVALVVSGVYNLNNSTPYPTPYLGSTVSEIREAPEGTEYFSILGVKLVVYALLLGALGFVIRRARALSESVVHRGGGATTSLPNTVAAGDSGGGGTAVLVDLPPSPAPNYSQRGLRLLTATLGVGAAIVVLCVNLLNTVHLTIEGMPAPESTSLTHVEGVQPIFSKVEVTKGGKGVWDVTLSLTDLHTKSAVTGVVVTVSGNGPGGTKYESVDFQPVSAGNYRGRVAGPEGRWELFAVASGREGSDIPPTQQSFELELGPDAKPTVKE